MTAVLDHLAFGTARLADGWELFGGILGGTWVYGGDSGGFWWGQLGFAAGPKVEMLTPAGAESPDPGFLDRFLAAHGAAPHHFNFLVTDFDDTLARIRAVGLEPIGVNRSNPAWLEAFLHHVRFARAEGTFSPQERERAGLLAKRLGLAALELA